MIYSINDITPKLNGTNIFIADSASVIGDVSIDQLVSIWFSATLRGDEDSISIGKGSNVQDNAVIHMDKGLPVIIGENVTIGHSAIVHGAKIGNNTLIGMGATILNGSIIGNNCILGANSLLKEGSIIPDNSLVVGAPAQVKKTINQDMIDKIIQNAILYQSKIPMYLNSLKKH